MLWIMMCGKCHGGGNASLPLLLLAENTVSALPVNFVRGTSATDAFFAIGDI